MLLLLISWLFAVSSTVDVQLIEDSPTAYHKKLYAIQNAKEEIFITTYIIEEDPYTLTKLRAIYEAAERGVEVKIILDDMSQGLSAPTIYVLNDHPNIEIITYHPLDTGPIDYLARLHDKIMAIDRKVFFLGGRNLTTEYYMRPEEKGVVDLDIKIMGQMPEIMKYLYELWNSKEVKPYYTRYYRDVFLSGEVCKNMHYSRDRRRLCQRRLRWYRLKAEEKQDLIREANPDSFVEDLKINGIHTIAKEDVKFIGDFSKGRKINKVSKSILEDLKKASVSIWITPYFAPNKDVRNVLIDTAQNPNQEVLVFTNSIDSSDVFIVNYSYWRSFDDLNKAGVRFFEKDQRSMLHGKMYMYQINDSCITHIGSHNMDPRSIHSNTESMIRINSCEFFEHTLDEVQKMGLVFEESTDSYQKSESTWKNGLYHILKPLLPILEPHF